MVEGGAREVLCSLNIQSERGLQLVLMANGVEHKDVARVTTRAQAKADKQEREENEASVARDKPTVKTLVPNGKDVSDEPGEEVELEVVEQESLGSQGEDVVKALCIAAEESEKNLGFEEDSYVDDDEEVGEEVYRIREESGEDPELVVPLMKEGQGSRVDMIREIKEDPTLNKWRSLADKKEEGLLWNKGLLFKEVTTHVGDKELLLVLPKLERNKVLRMAHDNLGHMGARRVKAIVKGRFTWPGMGVDIVKYCRSCSICQGCEKRAARKVPLMERRVMSEPFEVMGVDIVGPMPKGKGGCRYLLTAICMATKWPEAIPLRSISAKSVAVGLIEIFARTGIPLQLLSDQGAQFVGALMKSLCCNLRIDKIKTTPYHPEGNGCVERMHGTLGAMLTKAAKAGQDWVGQVPFALFALRAAPNRDTQYSPFELVFGRRVRTPLDIVHQGWVDTDFEKLDVEEWAEWLKDKLEVTHDVMRERAKKASLDRKIGFDQKTVNRELEKGDRVLCRIPGMAHKLAESWHGPYEVVDKLNRVDYKVEVGKKRYKVLHINNLKRYWEREAEVMRLVVVAEDFEEDEAIGTKVRGRCPEFKEECVSRLKGEFPEVFDDRPECASWPLGQGTLYLLHWDLIGCLIN